MVKYNLSTAIISRSKACYFAAKKMFTILGLFFLSSNVTVFTSCKQGGIKHEHYLAYLYIGFNYFFGYKYGPYEPYELNY